MGKEKAQLHIICDTDGLICARIVGPSDGHEEVHDLYFRIKDFIEELDVKIKNEKGLSTEH